MTDKTFTTPPPRAAWGCAWRAIALATIIILAMLLAASCKLKILVPDELTIKGPVCQTPMPIFSTDPGSRPDSVQIPCPWAYINNNGDTVRVIVGG